MQAFKTAHDVEYAKALASELPKIRALATVDDGDRLKAASDRLKLVQALDPTALKLATWPFDRASLVRYAIAPVGSLAASFGKELFNALAKP